MIEYIDLTIDFTNRNAQVGGLTLDRVTTRNYDTAIRFRIEVIGHTLDENYEVKILSKYNNSGLNVMTSLGDSLEIVDGKIIYTPKVNLITEADYVRNYLYLSKDGLGLDMAQFNYQVDVSQIGEVTLDIRQAYDESYETLLAEFEQALEDYKLTLPQADSVRAEIDVVLNQFGVDSQKAVGDLGEVSATVEIAEASRVENEYERAQAETERREAELLREENYIQKLDTAIVEADVVEKVDNKVTELTPRMNELTAQLDQTNMQTISPLDYGEIKLPSDFPKLPFAIYRDNDDRIKHNFSTKQFEENLDRIYYVSKTNGLDTNNGTSESTPLATLAGVYFKIGSNTNLKIKVIVLDNTLFYHGDISGGSIGSTYNIRDNNRMYITTKDKSHRITATGGVANLVWALESGYTKVFKTTHTEALYNAVDLRVSNRDVYGLPKPYKKVNSTDLVESTEGSYYVIGSVIYVHPIGGITPNNVDVLACVSSYAVRFNILANATLILENFDIIAGNPYLASTTPTTNTSLYTINCKVSEASSNGLGSNHIKKVYHFNPVVGYSKRDNINYTFASTPEANRRECLGFEYNATAYQSGYNDTNENNNASTAHDGACTLRIGTTGYEARGPVIADVNGCYSIILDCKARDSIASNPINQNIFYFDDINSLVKGKAYIINSTAKGTEDNKMLGSTEGFPIFLQLFKAKDLSKDLTITYIEGLPA